ncbi:hypothetical protein [Sphingorhabdus sp. Alg239-R122]|uniref:hypothetical protein n=1 Tax=Sphingorhabdus sp. Alg239-R122 TaxID=2305989 RepID=UPI0013D9B82F|nr:hypothetical protein [Sphingorhabdus sp. Alg239-R122]
MMTNDKLREAVGLNAGSPPQRCHFTEAYNVDLHKLGPSYGAAIKRAIANGELDCLVSRGIHRVSYRDLFELAGPAADPSDPDGGCFIPDHSVLS